MHNQTLAQMGNSEFSNTVIMYLCIAAIIFFIGLYIFRAVFNIPSFLRYQKAQMRLLEEIARHQGVEGGKVQNIITESEGWDALAGQHPQSNTQAK